MHKWFLLTCLFCSFSASAQKDYALAITHVTVIDCTGAAAMPNSTVLIISGRISAVGPNESVKIPSNARIVEAKDKFLIPGLWDMHGHLTDATDDAFPLLIMNGVTGVRDLGGDLAQIDRWRSEIDSVRASGRTSFARARSWMVPKKRRTGSSCAHRKKRGRQCAT